MAAIAVYHRRRPGDPNIAIITGASVGIGRAAAEAFLAEGFRCLTCRAGPARCRRSTTCTATCPHRIHQPGLPNPGGSGGRRSSVALVHNASQMLKDSTAAVTAVLASVLETNVVAINSLNQQCCRSCPAPQRALCVGLHLSRKPCPAHSATS